MSKTLELTTSRLILRPFQLQDYEPWSAMMVDPEVMRFLGGPQSDFSSWLLFRCISGAWSLDGFSRFSVLEKTTGQWVGWAGPLKPDGWPGSEIGWAIVRDRWGRGYATEAAAASIEWVFDQLGWSEIIHCIPPDNVVSQQVARKLGSYNRGPAQLPALEPGHEYPIEVWGQSREDWKAGRQAHSTRATGKFADHVFEKLGHRAFKAITPQASTERD